MHLPDENVIAEWLSDKKEKKVLLTVPQRGAKKALLDMACANARELLASARKKEEQKTASPANPSGKVVSDSTAATNRML